MKVSCNSITEESSFSIQVAGIQLSVLLLPLKLSFGRKLELGMELRSEGRQLTWDMYTRSNVLSAEPYTCLMHRIL